MNNVYQMVTDRIVAEMEKGIIPWHKPWFGAPDGAINYATRKPYSLLNQMLLGRSGEWLTFRQAEAAGGHIRKGEKASIVTYWQWLYFDKDGHKAEPTAENEGKLERVPLLRYYNVWHIDQCEGIKSKMQDKPQQQHEPIEEAENVIMGYVERSGIKFRNTKPSNKAYYAPMTDEVVVPMIGQYKKRAEYYSTTFHELTHSTGAASRLNRKRITSALAAFGSEEYSREELVAECGAAMLCNSVGIDCTKAFKNSVAYLQNWLHAIKGDVKMICTAAAQAERAADYILNKGQE